MHPIGGTFTNITQVGKQNNKDMLQRRDSSGLKNNNRFTFDKTLKTSSSQIKFIQDSNFQTEKKTMKSSIS